jgi:thiol-disulfide isomerase/thioredoxin
MYNLTIGPFTVQTSHLLMLAALAIAWVVATLSARPRRLNVLGVLVDAVLAALLAGRIVFVVQWFEQYRAHPWTMLDIRDGGVTPWAALAAGLLVVAWRCWRLAPLRRPMGLGVAAGLLAWQFSGAGALLGAARQPVLPALAFTALDGSQVTLAAAAAGKPAVVNLWASWCPPCRHEMPLLVEAQGQRKDIAIVFVNQGESAMDAAQFAAAQPSMRNVLLDPQAQLGHAVGSTAMPTTLFYDASGRLADMHIGVLSAATLAAKLERLR